MPAAVVFNATPNGRSSSDETSEVKTPLPCGGLKFAEEVPEVLQDVEYVQTFVADYINYRLSLEALEWPQRPILCMQAIWDLQLMRDVILAFETMHSVELKGMVGKLCDNKGFSWRNYTDVVTDFGLNDDETAAEMSYGRVVALIAFAGLVSVYAAKNGARQHITPVMMYTSRFIEKKIVLTWDCDDLRYIKRSWAEFFDLARVMRERQQACKWRYNLTEWLASSWLPWIGALGVVTFSVFSLSKLIWKH